MSAGRRAILHLCKKLDADAAKMHEVAERVNKDAVDRVVQAEKLREVIGRLSDCDLDELARDMKLMDPKEMN